MLMICLIASLMVIGDEKLGTYVSTDAFFLSNASSLVRDMEAKLSVSFFSLMKYFA